MFFFCCHVFTFFFEHKLCFITINYLKYINILALLRENLWFMFKFFFINVFFEASTFIKCICLLYHSSTFLVQHMTGVSAGYPVYSPEQQPVQQPSPAMSSVVLQPEQQMKLRKELDITQQNCKVFNEMLTELKPGQALAQEVNLLNVSVNNKCVHCIQKLIPFVHLIFIKYFHMV